MKTEFSLRRYALLVRDSLSFTNRDFVYTVFVTLGVILAILLCRLFLGIDLSKEMGFSRLDAQWGLEQELFWIGLWFVTIFGASRICSPLSNKLSSITYLMIPASSLEKYLARFTTLSPVAIIIYQLGFQVVDLIRCPISLLLGYSDVMPIGFSHLLLDDPDSNLLMICTLLTVQSTFALGSSFFPKRTILYTCLWWIAISFAMSLWVTMWLVILFPFKGAPVYTGYEFDFDTNTFIIVCTVLTCAVNYALAYFRFKEAEIIHRW